MTIKVSFEGNDISLQYQSFDTATNVLTASSSDEALTVGFDFPLDVIDTFDAENFRTFLFVRRDLKESNIFQVYDHSRNTRIGWCFPIQALASEEHSFAENEHFLRYAYVTAVRLFTDVADNIARIPDA